MNWDQILLMSVFLSLFFLVMTTLILYIRHWSSRHSASVQHNYFEGEYFKRYIPENLRQKYDRQYRSRHGPDGRYRMWLAKIASAFTVLGAVTISFYSLSRNVDTLLIPIDLTSNEIINLDYTQHQWQRKIDAKLPSLEKVLAGFSDRGFIVPYNDKDENWLFNGRNIRALAFNHWSHFAQRHKFKTLTCSWERLAYCQNEHPHWIVLVLPGYWDLNSMNAALKRGANLVSYGPPAQIDDIKNVIDWQGIKFLKVANRDYGEIILRGDQLLTLNFDAGLIIDAFSAFNGYQANAKNAQAVSFDAIYEVDAMKGTRLYAKSVGKGRLVWLDFPPDPVDNSLEVNVNHLNSVVAAVFRYLSRQPYSEIATWPHGKAFAALVDEDTEDQFANAKDVVKLSRNLDIPISWYILSNEAQKNRGTTRELAEVGEIACHGDHHGVFTLSNHREQVIRIARCKKVLTELTGIEPKAFRPPEERYNNSTIDAIANNGFDHYIAVNSPDRAVPEILVSLTNGKSLVSIPRMINDDYEIWHVRKLNYLESIRLFDGEVTWSRLIGGVHMFSFHTQYIDSHRNYRALEHLCYKLKNNDAYFETSQSIADWWRLRRDLSLGKKVHPELVKKFHPVVLSVDKNGKLTRTEFKDYHAS